MASLEHLLDSIRACTACGLMAQNREAGIRYVPIAPKPNAHFMFIGRDPSPRTAAVVGARGGRSVFIDEVFKIADRAGISEEAIYVTDLCKCHWRTSAGGHALPGTEQRPEALDLSVAQTCLNKWLVSEIGIVCPGLTVAFGEELYGLLRRFIINPCPSPAKFSATVDKSILDAEYWFAQNGPFSLDIGGRILEVAFLRHAGNSRRLPRAGKGIDKRRQFYEASVERVVQLLRERGPADHTGPP